MKRTLAFSVIFLVGTLTALAQPAASRRFPNPLLDDVVAMSRAGLSDATIVAYVQARRARLDSDMSADDLIRLQRAGVSERVVREIAGLADVHAPARDLRQKSDDDEMTYDSDAYGEDYPVGSSTAVEGYDYPYYDYLNAYGGYPYWYAYSPYFSGTFFFRGPRFFHGRGFGHGSFGHGSGHSGGHSGGHSSSHGGHSSGHSGGGGHH